MSEFDRRWTETGYVARSPGGLIEVRMTGDGSIRGDIDPSWFSRASRSAIESELAGAGKALYVERTRAYYDLSSEVAGMPIRPVREYASDEQREYFERLRELSAQGASADGLVRFTLIGNCHVGATVDDAALRLDAPSFVARCCEAADACFADHSAKWQRLHFDIYVRPRMERAGLL
ncbi:hypothetical protein [Nocardioides montaniterrae]